MHSHSWSDAGRRGWRWQVSVVLVMVMTLLVGMVVLVMMMAFCESACQDNVVGPTVSRKFP